MTRNSCLCTDNGRTDERLEKIYCLRCVLRCPVFMIYSATYICVAVVLILSKQLISLSNNFYHVFLELPSFYFVRTKHRDEIPTGSSLMGVKWGQKLAFSTNIWLISFKQEILWVTIPRTDSTVCLTWSCRAIFLDDLRDAVLRGQRRRRRVDGVQLPRRPLQHVRSPGVVAQTAARRVQPDQHPRQHQRPVYPDQPLSGHVRRRRTTIPAPAAHIRSRTHAK